MITIPLTAERVGEIIEGMRQEAENKRAHRELRRAIAELTIRSGRVDALLRNPDYNVVEGRSVYDNQDNSELGL